MVFIPKCMSTQHPDNAHPPAYAADGVIKGEAEIQEAAEFFQLGCDEQMWDSEGKDADTHVVQKLLGTHPGFFRDEKVLGKDCVITLRIPNPAIEIEMRKLLVEAMQGIPTAYDVALGFYGEGAEAPIQEVILPFTTSSEELEMIAAYYEQFIAGQEDLDLALGRNIKDWIGEFHPKQVRVIPLVEDLDHMLHVDDIVREAVQRRPVPYQRVFLARSDPALNYSTIGAELMLKVALHRLDNLERELGIPLYPIIGAGSVPFRGHLTPLNLDRAFREWPSVQTLTVQSAFKFDYPLEDVRKGIETIRAHERSEPRPIDHERAERIIAKLAKEYQSQVGQLAKVVAEVSAHVPKRRDRKLHVGLFGYGRSLAGSPEVTLPRAIGFAAAMYSIGIPPELLGMAALDADDFAFLREVYPSMDEDLAAAFVFANEGRVKDLLGQRYVKILSQFTGEIDHVHGGLTSAIWAALGHDKVHIPHYIEEAGLLRRFLG
ncbi:MAG: phosphoenolpyruvate carboxylase [Dehalococcoidia bacterium]